MYASVVWFYTTEHAIEIVEQEDVSKQRDALLTRSAHIDIKLQIFITRIAQIAKDEEARASPL